MASRYDDMAGFAAFAASRTSTPGGYRDLFGELVPETAVTPTATARSMTRTSSAGKRKRTPGSSAGKRKRTPASSSLVEHGTPTGRPRPARVFVPTPESCMRVMRKTQVELYKAIGVAELKRMSHCVDEAVLQELLSQSVAENVVDEGSIFKGVHAFVDYKFDNDRNATGINQVLVKMGAEVEKTFNKKVTHVIFRDGYRKTYTMAVERKIPLVGARWIEESKLAKKMLKTSDFPPLGLNKYTRPKRLNFDIPKSLKKYRKYLEQSDIESDELIMVQCEGLMKEVVDLDKNCRY